MQAKHIGLEGMIHTGAQAEHIPIPTPDCIIGIVKRKINAIKIIFYLS
jgi:hypothetical protein